MFDGILAQSTAHITLVSATMEGNWTRSTTAVHFRKMSSDSSKHIIYTVAYKNSITMVNDEKIRDTLIDLHNYAAMAIMLLDED